MKKIALITGANRGLGLAATKKLAGLGFKVLMGCRDIESSQEVINALQAKGLDVEAIKLDVTKTSDIRGVHDYLRDSKDSLKILVNNAGVFLDSKSESILNADPVIILKSIETNTMGPMQLIQSLAPLMAKSGGGQVINVSSGMGSLADMGINATGYRMSKTALNVLTKICNQELKTMNIAVNSICPGWCRTDMGGESATRSSEEGVDSIVWLAQHQNPPSGLFIRDREEIPW